MNHIGFVWKDLEEALTVFADPLAKVFDDPEHSDDEPRELIIGHSAERPSLDRQLHGSGPSDPRHRGQGNHSA